APDVLATAMEGASQVEALAGRMRLGLDPAGFVVEENDRLASYRTRVEGIFVAGCAQGPKDVQESSAQAAGASGALLSALVPGRKLKLEPAVARVDPALCGGCRACVGACPFQAVRYDQERRAAQVTEVLCRGCGTCAAGCPAGAIQALHFTAEQLGGEISALLEG
ncbi:MAG TPA: 4Fe-4S binding protein, partial [Myxococcota bacterium]|nr:4Fe-4S binding protein [Myxococcota bacterium]